MSELPLLLVTLGDPAGIGPEVTAKALSDPSLWEICRPVVVGSLAATSRGIADTRSPLAVRTVPDLATAGRQPGTLDVLAGDQEDAPEDAIRVGELSAEAGRASIRWIERAARLCMEGAAAGTVTGPVHKVALRMAGCQELGHLEIYKRMTGKSEIYTMLCSGRLRCLHLSTHLTLAKAAAYVTKANVVRALVATHAQLVAWGLPAARIAVAGLNPHAGDGGLIGREEIDELEPAVAEARARGIDAQGPIPADSVFNQAIDGKWDVVLALYHDQGHIAIKVHGFEESLSVNVGLPFLRTSVDHGTAFDIAGTGKAQATSMRRALELAASLARGHWS